MSASGRDQESSAIWVAVSQVDLPAKKYFKIGEVAHLVGVEPHVLRYWQTQFPQVRPHKSRSGHRLYRRKDVETLLAVRELLHVQRFTIAGARQALRKAVVHRGDITQPPMPATQPPMPAAQPTTSVTKEQKAEVPQEAQAELVLVGLGEPGLTQALDRELAVQQSPGPVAELDLRADVEAVGVEDVGVEAAGDANASVNVSGVTAGASDPSGPSPAAPSPSGPSPSGPSPSGPSVEAVAATADQVEGKKPEGTLARKAASDGAQASGVDVEGQPNFPLLGPSREALTHAREETLSLISWLDREEVNDRRRPFFQGLTPATEERGSPGSGSSAKESSDGLPASAPVQRHSSRRTAG